MLHLLMRQPWATKVTNFPRSCVHTSVTHPSRRLNHKPPPHRASVHYNAYIQDLRCFTTNRRSVREDAFCALERCAQLEPQRFRVWEFIKQWIIRMKRMYMAFAGVSTTVVFGLLYVSWMYGPQPARSSICNAFEKGFVPPEWEGIDTLADVPRLLLEADLAELLRPESMQTYGVVVGELGSGKSKYYSAQDCANAGVERRQWRRLF